MLGQDVSFSIFDHRLVIIANITVCIYRFIIRHIILSPLALFLLVDVVLGLLVKTYDHFQDSGLFALILKNNTVEETDFILSVEFVVTSLSARETSFEGLANHGLQTYGLILDQVVVEFDAMILRAVDILVESIQLVVYPLDVYLESRHISFGLKQFNLCSLQHLGLQSVSLLDRWRLAGLDRLDLP